MRRLVLAVLLFPSLVSAQRFGGTPPSIHWKQINTDSARIIFPQGLDSVAQHIAALVQYQAAKEPVPLGTAIRKINIVLQNQTTISNGYVSLGPFRSEFYLNPALNSFDLGSIPWADQLAIHEYRHVQQFNNFHHGLSQVMATLFGEEGFSLAINASIPDWFYEGDAVYNETILSAQGRGRLPLFMNAYPSLWQAHKKYAWMKLRNGSFKDYVPDHYNLGYLLVNYGREKYGLDFWEKVTADAAAFKGLFYPFQKAIATHAGVDYKTFRNQAFDYYKKMTGARAAMTKAPAGVAVFPVDQRVLTSYFFPYSITADSLLYLATSTQRRPAFYIRDKEGAHLLRVRDISIDQQYSYRNGKIVYAAYETDPRWSWRDYSVLKVLDITTGKQLTLTHRSKYFGPDISASGHSIAAVQIGTDGRSELHILDAATGEVKNRIRSAEVSIFTDPKFITEDSLVCAYRLPDGKMALSLVNLQTGSLVRLTPPSFNVVGYPCVQGNVIYFTASYGGNDDIFAIRNGDHTIYRLTQGLLGNYFVNAAQGKLTWSAFTAEGYQLRQMEEKDAVWTPVSTTTTDSTGAAYPVSHASAIAPVVPGQLASRHFPVSDYCKGTRLLNFHSWRPYYEDPEFTFSIYGENVLNTLQTEIYYLYNRDEKTNAAGFSAVYGKWFPYLSLGSQYTFDRQRVAGNRLKQWGQLDSRVGLSIPLNWVTGKTYDQFNAGTNIYYRKDFNKGISKDIFPTIRFGYLQHFISWGQQVQMATQHIYPRLGYNLYADYTYAITNYKSWEMLGKASVYLPGILPTHSLVLTGAYQETDTLNALFGNRYPYPRGYNPAFFARTWGGSANYHFPLFYPDWGFGNILYLQRVRANAFYDFARVFSNNKLAHADQRSVGGELFVDTKWWNQYELTFGIRVSYLLDRDFYSRQGKVAIFEFVLPVSILPE